QEPGRAGPFAPACARGGNPAGLTRTGSGSERARRIVNAASAGHSPSGGRVVHFRRARAAAARGSAVLLAALGPGAVFPFHPRFSGGARADGEGALACLRTDAVGDGPAALVRLLDSVAAGGRDRGGAPATGRRTVEHGPGQARRAADGASAAAAGAARHLRATRTDAGVGVSQPQSLLFAGDPRDLLRVRPWR